MIGGLIKAALGPIMDGVLRLIPDKNARAKAKEQFEGQILTALTGLVQGQLDINKEQAKHPSIFVAGARPAIMWICGLGLLWNFILHPIVMWVGFMSGYDLSTAPEVETEELTTILLGMLGLSGMRTYEKRIGVARESHKHNRKSGDK